MRVKPNQTSCYLRPPFLGNPLSSLWTVALLVHEDALIRVPVDDREAVRDVDDAALANPSEEGPDGALGALRATHVGVQDLGGGVVLSI